MHNNTLIHKGYTTTISTQGITYNCKITDRLGNNLSWTLHATTMTNAIAEVQRYFMCAIRYLRGFIRLSDFLDVVNGGLL